MTYGHTTNQPYIAYSSQSMPMTRYRLFPKQEIPWGIIFVGIVDCLAAINMLAEMIGLPHL